jgi:hypothetical protein
MATKKDVLERKKEASEKVSTQVRTLGVGVLAVTWGLLASDSVIALQIATTLRVSLMVIGVMAVIAILLDFLQFVLAHEIAKSMLVEMEAKKLQEIEYDYTKLTYRLMYGFYNWKQIVLSIATLYLICILGWYVWYHS